MIDEVAFVQIVSPEGGIEETPQCGRPMQAYSKPILGLLTIQSATFVELFKTTERSLSSSGTTTTWRGCIFARSCIIEKALPPDRRRGTFSVEDKLIIWLSERKLSGVNPWEDPQIANSRFRTLHSFSLRITTAIVISR